MTSARAATATTRERLVEAAIDVLADDGMAGFTHRRVEDRAGVSHGSTTYHFGTRDQLLDAALDRVLELEAVLSARAVEEVFAGTGEIMLSPALPTGMDWNTPETLALAHHIADKTLQLMISETRTVRARFELYLHAARHPESAARLAQARHAIYAAQEQQATMLGYPEPALYARLVTALMDGMVIHHLGVPDAVIRERGADLFISSLVALYLDTPRAWRAGVPEAAAD